MMLNLGKKLGAWVDYEIHPRTSILGILIQCNMFLGDCYKVSHQRLCFRFRNSKVTSKVVFQVQAFKGI
jgi:hypothetical protein